MLNIGLWYTRRLGLVNQYERPQLIIELGPFPQPTIRVLPTMPAKPQGGNHVTGSQANCTICTQDRNINQLEILLTKAVIEDAISASAYPLNITNK